MNIKNLTPNLDKFVLGTIIVSVLIIILGVFFVSKTSNPPSVNKEETKNILTVRNDDWVKGPAEATITLIEYLDFECEACRAYYPTVKQLKEEYKDNIRFVVRYFPLPGHKNSMTSALAVEAAGKQGKFWEMHDVLYENQKDWGEKAVSDPGVFEAYAKQIGLDMDKYKNDVNNNELKERINRDKNSGITLGVQGTPTFFINGERIPNPKGYEDFKSIIDGLMPEKTN